MSFRNLKHLRSGKVRDIYEYDENKLLFVTSNRISAFDVVLPNKIPNKGLYLNQLSEFWMRMFERNIPNHLTPIKLLPEDQHDVDGDAIIVKKLTPLPVEAIVRGYLIGSGWKDYQRTGRVCGIPLEEGLKQAQVLHEPIFTPSTKADEGHDMNITYDEMVDVLRDFELAKRIKGISIELYTKAHNYAWNTGIIIADTKFEFGVDENGVLHLIDEVLTSDSSRFWDKERYFEGVSPPSFDKQIVRDYLESTGWDKKPPAPELPQEIVDLTSAKYKEVLDKLTVDDI